MLPDDHPLMVGAGGWMKYNVAATVRKDDEELAAVPSNFNIGVPTPSMYNLDSYLNDEDIHQKDLCAARRPRAQHAHPSQRQRSP